MVSPPLLNGVLMKQKRLYQHAGQLSVLGLFLSAMFSDSALYRDLMLIIFPLYTMFYLASLCKIDSVSQRFDCLSVKKKLLDIEFYPLSYRALSTLGISMRPPVLENFFPNVVKLFFIYFITTIYFLDIIHEKSSYPSILIAAITISLVLSFYDSLLYRKKERFCLVRVHNRASKKVFF
ncbi:MAG: hypothetical protein D6694_08255 [Gammaproteobacteria bacterium]|nr:MAG: hypothetical protein D6694_08255 [Gammaproteobacteria bacterium]